MLFDSQAKLQNFINFSLFQEKKDSFTHGE